MITREEIHSWGIQEKLFVMEELWNSLSEDHADEVVPTWHKGVLEHRMQRLSEGKETYHSLEDIKKDFLNG